MAKPQSTRHALPRLGVFACSLGLALGTTGMTLQPDPLRAVLLMHLAACGAAFVLPITKHTRNVRLGLLAFDLVALVTAGYVALLPEAGSVKLMMPFLAAYVVATLVSFMGRRGIAATLGGLAGLMVLGMGLLFLRGEGIPEPGFVFPQVAWVALAAVETALVASWIDQRDAWITVSARVEQELRSREAQSAEVVSLVEALLDATTLQELAEAVLRHVRCHVPLRAHAIALASEGEEIAIWEESGKLATVQVERRRVLLQKGLARAGASLRLRTIDARSNGSQRLPERLDFKTAVDIPVRVAGRVAGVIFLADPERSVLPQDRISVMADVACRLGEALQRIEHRRADENRRIALLLQQMREGVLLLGGDGSVLLANPAGRRALDAAAQSSAGDAPCLGETSLLELGGTPPGIMRRFRVQVPGEGNAGPRELACTAVGVMNEKVRLGTLVTLSDVTEEELARRRLIQAERSTLVGQTLAGVAHELNNPLAAMLGYADLIKAHDAPENLQRSITRMCDQATRATKIVRNLLNFARRNNPQRVPVRLSELVESTVELFAYEARMHNVQVEVDIPDGLPPLLADKHAIQQILVNLVQNGIHALAQTKSIEGRFLHIHAREADGRITVTVRDSGPGVPDEVRARIFHPFFTTKGAAQGTGLGLALSLSIARDHSGDLLLSPDDGNGACFVLKLPAHDETVRKTITGEYFFPVPGHVLVVDDEPSVRETLVAQLGNMGSQVDSAANATEAERMISRQRYDVVLLDVRMPGSSGLDLHRVIETDHPHVANRIVFMTGDLANDAILSGVRKTGNTLLEKPFTMDELKRALVETRRDDKDDGINFTMTA